MPGQTVPQIQDAARSIKLKLDVLDAADADALGQAFATIDASGIRE